jgi:hypothetical protein
VCASPAHGADELLPALIIVVAHCPMRALSASLAFIGSYRHPHRLEADGEGRYYLTLATSALEFVASCEAHQLVGISHRAFGAALALGLRNAAENGAEAEAEAEARGRLDEGTAEAEVASRCAEGLAAAGRE